MFPNILQLTEGYIWTIWKSLESVLRLSKNVVECSSEDSVFSRLCHINLITYPKSIQLTLWVYLDHLEQFGISFKTFNIFQFMDGYILTILEHFRITFRFFRKIPRNVPRKIPWFPYCVILCEVSIRWSLNLTRITLRLFGVVSQNLESVVNILSKFNKIPSKFRVFQIVSYQLN